MKSFSTLRTLGLATAALGMMAVSPIAATQATAASGNVQLAQADQNRKLIGDIQLGLDSLNYDTGLIDGIMGPKTAGAIEAYQADSGLPVNGKPSENLLAHILKNPKSQETGVQPRMRDDFEDGDYKNNPKWKVHSGEFQVRNGFLSTRLPDAANRDGRNPDVTDKLRDLFDSTDLGAQAAISQDNAVPSNFRIAMTLLGSGKELVQMHFGPYIGNDVKKGYRLTYDQLANGRLALLRRQGDRTTVLAEVRNVAELGDGRRHLVVWTRDAQGEIVVTIDRREVLRANDRSFPGDFAGLSFINGAGTWNVHDVAVYQAR